MKRTLQIILGAFVISVLAFSALAEDLFHSKTEGPVYSRERRPYAERLNRLNDAAKASDILGMTVKNYKNETLGKVEDIALDVQSGRIVQVILSTGGFIGIGDRLTAVPPGALDHDTDNDLLHLDADKEKLKDVPHFEMSKWAEYSSSNHLSEVYRHFGEEPAFVFIQSGDVVLLQPNTDRTLGKDRIPNETRSMIPVSRLSNLQKGKTFIGMPVLNLQDETLGQVENILIDLPSGRIVAVIISSGGFLGMGDELSAVPPTALRFTMDRNTLLLDASKEMFLNAPHFKADQWPDFAEPSYADGVYRAYQVEPYFSITQVSTEPNNTALNARDQGGETLTPFDQGDSKADIQTTAQIRKEIIAGKDMSVNAKNVKIITDKGHVTLRGPVNTAFEKRFIGEIAIQIARRDNVDNQIEVMPPPVATDLQLANKTTKKESENPMSKKSVFCISTSNVQAERILDQLKSANFFNNDISLLFPDKQTTRDFAHEKNTKAPEGAIAGAGTGGVIGGALGWIAGIGALAIPGVGPFIAAGPIMAALSGAAIGATMGGIAGSLIGMGIPELEAKRYEGKINAGNILISVHTENSEEITRAKDIFSNAGAEDICTTDEASTPKGNKATERSSHPAQDFVGAHQ